VYRTEKDEVNVSDIFFVILVIVFFLACWGMTVGLDKLKD
jgi:hypothetical protein